MRLVLENLTVTGIAGGLNVAFSRSTNRYSTRAVFQSPALMLEAPQERA